MSRIAGFLALGLGAAALAGCADADVAGPGDAASGASSVATSAAPADVGGTWNWSNLEQLRMPPFIAAMVNIAPEGPNTHARCRSAGVMTLVQTGATFQGTAVRTLNECTTNGGQQFQQPGAVFQVEDGRIRGASLHFSFSSFLVRPCPHQAVVKTASQAGTAMALRGTGHCVLPGHPRSDSPLPFDPPPGGTSTTLRWEAVRP